MDFAKGDVIDAFLQNGVWAVKAKGSTRRVPQVVAMGCMLAGLAATACAQAGFHLISGPPGSSMNAVLHLSADGSTAVGSILDHPSVQSFTWTAAGGRRDVLPPPGEQYIFANRISGDGQWLLGSVGRDSRSVRARGALYEYFSPPTGYTWIYANGINKDGSVLSVNVGGFDSRAARYVVGSDVAILPLPEAHPTDNATQAMGISRDGSTVYGITGNTAPSGIIGTGIRWRNGVAQVLPGIGWDDETRVTCASDTGAIVAGSSTSGASRSFACYWNEIGALSVLPTFGTYNDSSVYAMTANGSIMAGSSSNGGSNSQTQAMVWEIEDHTVVRLADYLSRFGVQVPPNFILREALTLSADGRTFAGYGEVIGGSQVVGFVATIPAPASVAAPLLLLAFHRRRRGS